MPALSEKNNSFSVLRVGVLGLMDCLLLLGVFLPILLGLLYRLHILPSLLRDGPLEVISAPVLSFAFLAFLPFAAAVATLTGKRVPGNSWVLGVVFLAILIRLVFINSVDTDLTSDYKSIWDFAVGLHEGSRAKADQIPFMRALPYFWPLAILGDGSRLVFEVVNGLVSVATSLIGLIIVRNIAGQKAGFSAFIIMLFSPEPIFSCEVSTHDIPGAFFLLGGVACLYFAYRNWQGGARKPVVFLSLIFIAALFIGVLEVQRSTGKFVLLALLLIVVAMWCCGSLSRVGSRWQNSLLAPLTLFGFLVVGIVLVRLAYLNCCTDVPAITKEYHFNQWAWVASYSGPGSVGDYSEYAKLMPQLHALAPESLPEFALRKVAGEYAAEPFGFVRHYAQKAQLLYNLGRQGREYYGGSVWRQAYDAYTGIYSILLLGFSLFAFVVSMLVPRERPENLFVLYYLAILSLALIAVGEIQSRYAAVAWYALPMYLMIGANRFSTHGADMQYLIERLKGFAVALPVIALAFSAGLYTLISFAI